jgi:hypothetical protein
VTGFGSITEDKPYKEIYEKALEFGRACGWDGKDPLRPDQLLTAVTADPPELVIEFLNDFVDFDALLTPLPDEPAPIEEAPAPAKEVEAAAVE